MPPPTTLTTWCCIQAVLEYVSETVSDREMEAGMAVLLRLSHSVAVQNMTSLCGMCIPQAMTQGTGPFLHRWSGSSVLLYTHKHSCFSTLYCN